MTADFKDLIKEAETVKYCRNCKLSYIREDAEYGYCMYTKKDKPIEVPKLINEYDVCKHWKSKVTKRKATNAPRR